MSSLSSYPTKAFKETQKFLVRDPATGSPSFVLGSDLVSYITPKLNYVRSETTRLAAENADYKVGNVVQTTGATSVGDGQAALYLVVASGEGDFPMLNGNELLVIAGDEFLREQLASNATGDGTDLITYTGTADTVTQTFKKRVTSLSDITSLSSLNTAALVDGQQFSVSEEGRAGTFTIVSGTKPADTQEALYVGLDATTYAERVGVDEWQASWFIKPADTSFNPALAGAEALSNQGQTLRLPDQTLTLVDGYTERLQLIGNSKKSILKAGAGASQIIDFGRHAIDWDYHEIANVTFDGNAKASNGTRFNDDSASFPEFGGRWTFQACRWSHCDKGFYQATGNIGNRIKDSNFRDNNFGMYLQNAPSAVMHAGAILVEGCELSLNQLAAIYVNDSQDGLGSYSFKDTVIEGNPGFGLFMDLNDITPFTGIHLDNLWFEANASAASVTIDGVVYTPRDMYFRNAKPIIARGVNLKDVELVNSTLIGYGCRLDDATGYMKVDIDSTSEMILYDVFSDGQPSLAPMVNSIASQSKETNTTSTRGFRGPLRTHRAPSIATTVYKNNFDGAGPWTFTGTVSRNATSVADGVISDICAELVINDGETLLSPDKGTPTAGKWAAFGIHAKLVSGAKPSFASLGGSGTVSFTQLAFKGNAWTCSYGVAKIGSTVNESRLRFVNNTGAPITLRLADMFVIEFDTEAEALAFANSRAALK